MKEIQGPSETLSEYYALGEFVEYMRAQRKYSEHTCKAYSKDITQFYEFLSLQHGGEKAADPGLVTRIDMRLFLGFLLKKGLQPKSIARKLASVKSFYNYLLETGRIKVSVPAQVVTPRFSKTVPGFLNEEQTETLFDHILAAPQHLSGSSKNTRYEDEFTYSRDRAILELLYGCGLRISEVVHLEREQVNIEQGFMKINGKGNKQRVLPLGSYAVEALKNYFEVK